MPAPLSRDLRERIVEAIEGGSSMRGAAARFAVSPSSAIKLMARVRAGLPDREERTDRVGEDGHAADVQHIHRRDDDLATVYLAWSGYAYGRDGYGVPAPEAMRRRFQLIDVAVKNQDNREHDIFDSDDYLQEHGGMVATVRSLRGGQAPQAFFGDSADPERPRVRTLAEEARRVVRSRVLNPRWISAMMRHGYKGAFEMAATVDYLYGYDATARIGEDWMYEQVTQAYVADPEVRKFFAASNPWALQGIAERLLEAAARGLWQASDASLTTLHDAVLEAEGWAEERPS